MNLTALFVQLVQLIKGLAAPIAVLVALYWFRKEIKAVLEALAYFIRERKFKGTFPGGSVEVGGGAEAELQKYIDASATPPPPPPPSRFRNSSRQKNSSYGTTSAARVQKSA